MDVPQHDKRDRLERAGISLDALPPAQRRVLIELSDDEIDTLAAVRERLVATGEAADAVGVFYY